MENMPTIFRIDKEEVARLPFALSVARGDRVNLGEKYDGRDLRVSDLCYDLQDEPALIVDLGEQRGPALTPA
jgi:hypothetical protein